MAPQWHHYRFRSIWLLPAPPDTVRAVLERAEDYPLWWRQIREVHPESELTGTARFRSLLPLDLEITARVTRSDPRAGVLEIAMSGDLEGWVRWTLEDDGSGGTRAVYEQRVEVRKPLMRALSVPGRPLFRINHALMMRSGRRGLCRLLRRGVPGKGFG